MVRLRPMQPDDKPRILAWRNRPEVARYMYSDHHISFDEHEAWFSRALQDPTRRDWIIVADGEDVGLISLSRIDFIHRRCYWGFYLASPNVRGKGIGSLAWYSVLQYAFNDLNLHKLCSEVLDTNAVSITLHKAFGFQVEGRLRQHILKQGIPHDVVVFGLLREEWQVQRPSIEERLRAKGLL